MHERECNRNSASNTNGRKSAQGRSEPLRTAAIAGSVGGAISGLIASYAPAKLGFAAVFVVLIFVMGGLTGISRKALAILLFAALAALVRVVLGA